VASWWGLWEDKVKIRGRQDAAPPWVLLRMSLRFSVIGVEKSVI